MQTSERKNIKVAHLITGLEVGGTERSLLALLPRMQNKGISNHVYCIVGQGEIGKELERKGISVKYLDYKGWLDIFRMFFVFLKELRQERPDILVTYLIHADLFGRIIGRLSGVKKIVSYKRGNLLQWDFLYLGERITRGLVNRYVTVSEELKRNLIARARINKERISVIRNGIDIEKYAASGLERKRIRTEFGIGDNEIAFGVVAKLRRGKGHLALISAFQKVLKERPDTTKKLFIVGDGEEEQNLKKHARDLRVEKHVIFAGCRNDIASILSAIDIFVLPTEYEGMSVALLEAMAAKKPIITTSIEANIEILGTSDALMIPPRDISSLEKAMLDLLEDENLRGHLAETAFKKCQENYSVDKSAQQFVALLKTS